ncbi:MAG: hypothetical protein OXJ52_02720 [Oligoflexia bacterium]|nr:hypothetical protein [Oligoflexia bacterium]
MSHRLYSFKKVFIGLRPSRKGGNLLQSVSVRVRRFPLARE